MPNPAGRVLGTPLARRAVLRSALAGGTAATLGGAALGTATPASAGKRVREYWIQADAFQHNYVPNGRDDLMGTEFAADDTTMWVVGYRAYDPHWKKPLPAGEQMGPNGGLPGPIVRGTVGDTIVVHFRNNDTHYRLPHSIHPHGVWYDPASDGMWRADDPQRDGTAVPPGGTYTYTWQCQPSSVGAWVYHDHSKPASVPLRDGETPMPLMEFGVELGLYGTILVTDHHTAPADREFVLFMQEMWSTHLPLGMDLMGFNGGAFAGNTPTIEARVGERIRLHVLALGWLPHVFHLHGHRWSDGRRYVDAQSLGPSEALTLEWIEDNPGEWLYHCHYPDHMAMGMAGWYRVHE